jgi:tRNA-Thr(GGU) m(6)t(6)A37 methyltransferase TsaA
MAEQVFEIYSIGYIRRVEGGFFLEISETYRPALKQLEHFSHILVLWWADRYDNDKGRTTYQCHPAYAQDRLTGVFACRSEYRPNPIALTTCKLLSVDEANGIVHVANIDAFNGTPILDIKAYFPTSDRVKDVYLPEWLSDWPEWMPEGGLGL